MEKCVTSLAGKCHKLFLLIVNWQLVMCPHLAVGESGICSSWLANTRIMEGECEGARVFAVWVAKIVTSSIVPLLADDHTSNSLENRTLQMFPYLPTTKSTGICIYTLWLLSCHWSNRMLHGPFLAVYNSKTKTKSNVIGAKYSSILKWSTSLQCKATPNIAPHDPHLLVLLRLCSCLLLSVG